MYADKRQNHSLSWIEHWIDTHVPKFDIALTTDVYRTERLSSSFFFCQTRSSRPKSPASFFPQCGFLFCFFPWFFDTHKQCRSFFRPLRWALSDRGVVSVGGAFASATGSNSNLAVCHAEFGVFCPSRRFARHITRIHYVRYKQHVPEGLLVTH